MAKRGQVDLELDAIRGRLDDLEAFKVALLKEIAPQPAAPAAPAKKDKK